MNTQDEMNFKPEGTCTLYTIQTAGQDITVKHEALFDYIDDKGAFYDMAQYLKWPYWIWAFEDTRDFDNNYMDFTKIPDAALWILQVPRNKVVWCSMKAQCERTITHISDLFYSESSFIRKSGDIPEGLIKAPVDPSWVVKQYIKK